MIPDKNRLLLIYLDFNYVMEDEHRESLLTQNHLESMEFEMIEEECKFDGLSKTHIWAYGVGHFVNDLVAACWFNYLLFFLNKVVKT